MAREVVAARYFGDGPIWSAFQYAFTIPNLFRKLLGEGALSAAFIPLYTRSLRDSDGRSHIQFASAAVTLLLVLLAGVIVIGELILLATLIFVDLRPSTELAVKLTMMMLPYVLFVCGAAFLSGILQVHRRFFAAAATSVVLNLLMVSAIWLVAQRFDLSTNAGQLAAVWWVSIAVLIAGAGQVAFLVPSLARCGFAFHLVRQFWTPAIRNMLLMSLPVALSASVLQIGVVLDKQISLMLAAGDGQTHFDFFGYLVPFPMEPGALARLNWAQFLYQFPLGVFAIALATAIFPQLSGDALAADQGRFREVLRRGILAALFIGLPASAGMMLVSEPAVRLLFERGQFSAHSSQWTALSTFIYSSAIWAFSVQQIINRGYYALHDMRTPLIWTAINLGINLVVEIPLLWTPLGESAMAVGTLASFVVQTSAMTYLLSRRIGLELKSMAAPIGKMLLATAAMAAACLCLRLIPGWPGTATRVGQCVQLVSTMLVGATTYFAILAATGVPGREMIRRRR